MNCKVCFNDFLAAIAVFALAVILFVAPIIAKPDADYVKITTNDGEQIVSISQNTELQISSNGYNLSVKIEDGKVFVDRSTCPDKVCVNSGKISSGGDVVVCAPALVSVEIIGSTEDVDYAVG